MKVPFKFLRFHPLALLSIGVGVGLICGWSLGRTAGYGTAEPLHPSPAQSQAANGGAQQDITGANTSDGRRDRETAASKKVSEDLARSARAIFQENVKARRIARFEKLVEKTGVDRLPELVALIRENDLRGNDSGDEWTRIWVSWSERDPQSAIDFFTTYDWTGWSPLALGEARNRTLATWAHADPEMARRFVEADEGFMNGDRAMVYGLVEGWANTDPGGAADWLFRNGLAMGDEYEKIVAAFRRNGGQEGLESWFFKLDPTTVPDKDLAAFARSMNPAKTAEWIGERHGEAWVKDSEMVVDTARALARQDPEGAVRWAVETGLEDAMHFAISGWCEKDLEAASGWVKENPNQKNSLQAATVVMAYLRHKDPAAAREWADSIPDQSLRDQLR
ncbi:hypothetical protein JIN84_20615 [Luteolibacter yonseiensis]|uniref:Uncharacterized protein n=1 Tax=Luteolibacter yonseiensis TaxID=1144680 RepID=A0A934R8U4_9BACT|nr:hypothetical protein [Luteolibacter yonseiensis]MBK1818038.1 hypothetical protein [Luteolibacter yonseiensis]